MLVLHPPRSALLVLLTLLPSSLGCTESKSSNSDCEAVCDGQQAAFSLLAWDEDTGATRLGDPLTMEYGPQGGQHVFLAVEIGVPTRKRLRFSFDYIDDESGDVLAHASWQEDPDSCGMLLESIPLVFRKDEQASGRVEMTVTADGCEWKQASTSFEALPPQFDGDSGGADAGAADDGDAGGADSGVGAPLPDAGSTSRDGGDASARAADHDAASQ